MLSDEVVCCNTLRDRLNLQSGVRTGRGELGLEGGIDGSGPGLGIKPCK